MTDRNELIERLEGRLDQWDRQIEQLQTSTDRLDTEARTAWQQSLDRLRDRRDQARKRLDELRSASADAWQDMRAGAEQAWQELGDAVRSAADQLKQ